MPAMLFFEHGQGKHRARGRSYRARRTTLGILLNIRSGPCPRCSSGTDGKASREGAPTEPTRSAMRYVAGHNPGWPAMPCAPCRRHVSDVGGRHAADGTRSAVRPLRAGGRSRAIPSASPPGWLSVGCTLPPPRNRSPAPPPAAGPRACGRTPPRARPVPAVAPPDRPTGSHAGGRPPAVRAPGRCRH